MLRYVSKYVLLRTLELKDIKRRIYCFGFLGIEISNEMAVSWASCRDSIDLYVFTSSRRSEIDVACMIYVGRLFTMLGKYCRMKCVDGIVI